MFSFLSISTLHQWCSSVKSILSLVVLFACTCSALSLEIPVNWKVGDSKTFSITSTSYEGEPGNVVAGESETNTITVSVIADHGDQLEIDIEGIDNEFEGLLESLQEKASELGELPDIQVQLVVDKKSGEFDIRNWNEVSQGVAQLQLFFAGIEAKMNEKIDESTDEEDSEAKDMARAFGGMFIGLFKSMSDLLATKDGIVGMCVGDLAYITVPFGHDFEIGKTVSETENFSNSLGVMAELTAEVDRTLTGVEGNTATMSCQMRFDEEGFIAAIKKMMMGMFAGFLGEEEAEAKIAAEFDGMSADLKTDMTILVDTKTGWISNVTMKNIMSMTSADGEKEYTENITKVVVQ